MGMAAGVNNISDQRKFIRRLTETIFWCRDAGSLAQPKTSLRTCKPKDLTGGRLLAYFPDNNLACGVAEVESQGFFDTNNIPPYDTWGVDGSKCQELCVR
jgi:hypothetical protein